MGGPRGEKRETMKEQNGGAKGGEGREVEKKGEGREREEGGKGKG